MNISKEHEATVLCALAHYALSAYDPSGVYAAIEDAVPDVEWDEWIVNAEAYRERRRALTIAAVQA